MRGPMHPRACLPLTLTVCVRCAPDLDVYNRAITLAQGPMAKLFQQAATA